MKGHKMRDFNGKNYGTINDYSINFFAEGISDMEPQILKKKTKIQDIIKEKVIEGIVGVVLGLVAAVINAAKTTELFNSLTSEVKIFLYLLIIFGGLIGFGLVAIFIFDIINLFDLSKNGNFVEFESKFFWADKFAEIFRNSENSIQKEDRAVGKCYKNINGEIYEIKGAKCPICETKPIGNMYLRYSNKKKVYFWECSQNQAHKIMFDYKKKF